MKLNTDTFVYKLYAFCYMFTQKFFNDNAYNEYNDEVVGPPESTNLCSLMRTILVWAPLYFIIVGLLVYGYGYVIFYMPFTYGGFIGYYNVYVVPFMAVGAVGAVLCLYAFIRDYINPSDEAKLKLVEAKEFKQKTKEERIAAGKYTFREIFVRYIVAGKKKICPLVDIVKENDK